MHTQDFFIYYYVVRVHLAPNNKNYMQLGCLDENNSNSTNTSTKVDKKTDSKLVILNINGIYFSLIFEKCLWKMICHKHET